MTIAHTLLASRSRNDPAAHHRDGHRPEIFEGAVRELRGSEERRPYGSMLVVWRSGAGILMLSGHLPSVSTSRLRTMSNRW
jgi:hypothetical protein